jgi:hypothetical protein
MTRATVCIVHDDVMYGKLKMTDFGIEPPAPKLPGGLAPIKTGAEIKFSFEWVVVKR